MPDDSPPDLFSSAIPWRIVLKSIRNKGNPGKICIDVDLKQTDLNLINPEQSNTILYSFVFN